ncbi:MAG: solute:hydrogen antiporter [Subtercola sp.]|nr:solute:hydrogen antiporter [Subtercola sp.]
MTLLIAAVVALLAIAAASTLSPRLRIAAPLILVVAGIAVSFLPFIPTIEIDPEWILAGVLPPLLYSASVSMPTMNFRREFTAIGGLSVVLVVLSSVILGFFFAAVIPGLGIWWGIALGAIVSPTDAVATSIVKRVGVSGRVVSVLEGESLLNDATALVLLRAAIAGTAATVSFWGVLGNFAYSVLIASVLGVLVGQVNLRVRSKITDSTVNTVVSFTVPFLASIPAELLGASGLVAAVVAGLVTGHGAARRLPPQHRLSDSQNWHTVELVLEGLIFLVMGLELSGIIADVQNEHAGVGAAFGVAAGALALTIIVRAGYIAPLLSSLRRRARRGERVKPRLDVMKQRFDDPEAVFTARDVSGGGPGRPVGRAYSGGLPGSGAQGAQGGQGSQGGQGGQGSQGGQGGQGSQGGQGGLQRPAPSAAQVERVKTRTIRTLADIDYYVAAPLGWREGGILVWAGMRGAVTLAAAQTLPENTPYRSLLVLIAFVVAAGSLLIQGGTLAAFVKWIKPSSPDRESTDEERERVLEMLRAVAVDVTAKSAVDASTPVTADDGQIAAEATDGEPGRAQHVTSEEPAAGHPVTEPDDVEAAATASSIDSNAFVNRGASKKLALDIIAAQRTALLDASDDGTYTAETLNHALANLDADQISIELKGAPPEI